MPPRPVVPGERRYRDGDRVRHAAFGEGTVVTSKLTRDDEEVTVAFPARGVKKLLASLANLELLEELTRPLAAHEHDDDHHADDASPATGR